jgi:hypothetical protein
MQHDTDTLSWHDCNQVQVRGVLMRHGISGSLGTEAVKKFNDPAWDGGPHIVVIDTMTDHGARIDNDGGDTYDVSISRLSGCDLLDHLSAVATALGPDIVANLDKIVIID